MKKCPYCAEEIQDEAVVCRFCRFDLKTGKSVIINTPIPKQVAAKSGIGDGVKLGCGLLIFGFIILAVGGASR